MTKLVTRHLSATVAAALAVLLVSVPASARRHRRRAPAAHINAKALAQLMGPYKFGMTKKDILGLMRKEIAAQYADKIKKTTDIYKQDKLRRERKKKLAAIADTYITFEGKKTGWDVSIIDDQFFHNTDESMLVRWEYDDSGKNQRRFFFFHHGRLYKMFVALNSSMLKGEQRTFAFFQKVMVQRYGPGQLTYKTDIKGEKAPDALQWHTRNYHVSALNKLDFYGSFCLVIADPQVEKEVAEVRAAVRRPKAKNNIMKAIIETDPNAKPGLDENSSTIDSVTR